MAYLAVATISRQSLVVRLLKSSIISRINETNEQSVSKIGKRSRKYKSNGHTLWEKTEQAPQ